MAKIRSISRRNLNVFKWLIPLGLVLVVTVYEFGPSHWIFERYGLTNHVMLEILLFGTLGPLLTFFLLELVNRWIEEKETADLQARLLAQAEEKDREIRQISDDTLQVLFATYMLISAIKSDGDQLPRATLDQIEITEKALDESISHLRFYLLN